MFAGDARVALAEIIAALAADQLEAQFRVAMLVDEALGQLQSGWR